MSKFTEAFYPAALKRVKAIPSNRLQEAIARTESYANAIEIQEQGWSKRSEKPYGPLYDGWVEELQKAAEEASGKAFELECYDVASKLHYEPKFNGSIVYGEVDGRNVRVETTTSRKLDAFFKYETNYMGEVDGLALAEEDAKFFWDNVGRRVTYIDQNILKSRP